MVHLSSAMPRVKVLDLLCKIFYGGMLLCMVNYLAVHSFSPSTIRKIKERLYSTGSVKGIVMVDCLLNVTMEHLNNSHKRRMLKY
jgi:hypothetical protein